MTAFDPSFAPAFGVAAAAGSLEWTTVAQVRHALGAGVTTDDYLDDCVAASNDWCYRKRVEAGYVDPADGVAPSFDVAMGATLYAVALWRERASTDGYSSFEDLATFAPTGGSSAQIRKLLGIGRAAVDRPRPAASAGARRRMMIGRLR